MPEAVPANMLSSPVLTSLMIILFPLLLLPKFNIAITSILLLEEAGVMDSLNPIFTKLSEFVEKAPFKVPCLTCKIFPPTPVASFAAVTAPFANCSVPHAPAPILAAFIASSGIFELTIAPSAIFAPTTAPSAMSIVAILPLAILRLVMAWS